MTATDDGATVSVELGGADRAAVREEELDALAYVLQKAAGGRGADRRAVVVECGGLRIGRDEQLRLDVRRMIDEVRTSGQPRDTGSHNAYERRIIHMVVREAAGVTSYSVGEGSERRTIIAPLGGGGGSEVM